MTNKTLFNEIKNQISDKADFVGAVINLNVRLGEDTVPVSAVREALAKNQNIPKDWLPEEREPLSLYLSVASGLNRNSARSFIFPEDYPAELREKFRGYSVTRLWYKKDSDMPCAHRVIYKHATTTEVDGKGAVQDVEIEHSLMVILNNDPDTGLQLSIQKDDDFDPEARIFFDPFLHTLLTQFEERVNGEYNSTEVRKIILDVVHKHIGARSVNEGLYFVQKELVGPINEFCETINSVHNGVSLLNFAISKGAPGSIEEKNFQMVQQSLSHEIIRELKDLQAELLEFEKNEDTTRDSTWHKRAQRINEVKAEIKRLRDEHMLISDLTDNLIDACTQVIKRNI